MEKILLLDSQRTKLFEVLGKDTERWINNSLSAIQQKAEEWCLSEIENINNDVHYLAFNCKQGNAVVQLKAPLSREAAKEENRINKLLNRTILNFDEETGISLAVPLLVLDKENSIEKVIELSNKIASLEEAPSNFQSTQQFRLFKNLESRIKVASKQLHVKHNSQLFSILNEVRNLMSIKQVECKLLHGNLADHNIKIDGSTVYAINFMPAYGDRQADLAYWTVTKKSDKDLISLATEVAEKANFDKDRFFKWIRLYTLLELRTTMDLDAMKKLDFLNAMRH